MERSDLLFSVQPEKQERKKKRNIFCVLEEDFASLGGFTHFQTRPPFRVLLGALSHVFGFESFLKALKHRLVSPVNRTHSDYSRLRGAERHFAFARQL